MNGHKLTAIGMVLFFTGLITCIGFFAGQQIESETEACTKQGGAPKVIRSEVLCFAPGAQKGTP